MAEPQYDGLVSNSKYVTMDLDGELALNNDEGAVTMIKFAVEV